MEIKHNAPAVSGFCQVFLNDDTTPVAEGHNAILPAAAFLFASLSSPVTGISLKLGANNAPNVAGQSTLNAPYEDFSNLLNLSSNITPANNISYVVEPGGDLVFTVNFLLKIKLGYLSGVIGELGVDFTSNNSTRVHTRVPFATPFNITIEDELRVSYFFTFRLKNPTQVVNLNYDVDGALIPATCTISYVNLGSWTWDMLLKNAMRFSTVRWGQQLPTNPATYVATNAVQPTKVFTNDGVRSICTMTFSLTAGNFANGLGCIQAGSGTLPFLNFAFDPPIPKNANTELELTMVADYSDLATIGGL